MHDVLILKNMNRVCKILTIFLFPLLCLSSFAQTASPDSLVVSYVDSLHLWQEVRLSYGGELYSRKYYSDSLLTQQEYKEIYYYMNGREKSVAEIQNNEFMGNVTSYYSSGQIRRVDYYENGTFVSGDCFATNGMKIPHYDYKKDAVYPGGISALYTIISVNSQQITLPDGYRISGMIQVKLTLNKKGKIIDKKVVKGLHPLYDAEVLRICEHLGIFEPEERDGEPVVGSYILSLKF